MGGMRTLHRRLLIARQTLTGWWRSMFARLILSFTILLVLAYLAFFGALSIYERHIEDRFQVEAQQRAELIAGSIGQYFDQLQAQMRTISLTAPVRSLNQEGTENWLSVPILQAMNEIVNSRLGVQSMKLVDKLVVFNEAPESPILSSVGTIHRHLFFETFYVSEKYGEEAITRMLRETNGFRVLPPDRFMDRSIYGQTGADGRKLIPMILRNFSYDHFMIIALIDVNRLVAHHLPELPGVRYQLYSLTGQERLVGSEDQPLNDKAFTTSGSLVFHEDRSVSYLRSYPELDLRFAMHLSNEAWTAGLRQSRRLALFILLISALFCFWLAVTISSRFNNPVRQIREMLQSASFSQAAKTDDLQAVRDDLRSLIELQDSYRTTLRQQDSVLRELYYEHRIRNLYWQGPELFRLSVHFPYFLIATRVYLRRGKEDVLRTQKTKASRLLCDLIGQHISGIRPESITFQMDDEHFLSVVSDLGDGEPQAVAEELAERLNPEEEFAYFDFAVGQPAKQISELHDRYLDVMHLLEGRELVTRTQIITRQSAAGLASAFILPQIQLNRLTAALSSASREGVEKELVDICRANAGLSLQAATVRFLYETLMKSAFLEVQRGQSGSPEELHVVEPVAALGGKRSIDECHQLCLAYYLRCIDYLEASQQGRETLLDQLLEYLRAHFHEDIYLDLLADQTGYSASYLSAYFKRKMQVNLLDYLNAMRIDRADELLRTTECLIKDVAHDVGIPNINTFNRLFRQYRGCTPSEWRSRHGAIGT